MTTNDILTGKVCPYCNSKTEFIDSSFIYGKSYGMIYICKPCDAYVGVHKGTDQAKGSLANKVLRKYRKLAHEHFDKIAKTDIINKIFPEHIESLSNRKKSYLWLSKKMGISEELCHIGMMNEVQCITVANISIKALNELYDLSTPIPEVKLQENECLKMMLTAYTDFEERLIFGKTLKEINDENKKSS